MRFKKFLLEALLPSQFRYYVKLWKESGIAKRYDKIFGNKDRIYIPFQPKFEKGDLMVPWSLREMLLKYGWKIVDYYQGYAEKNGKIVRIGKILNDIKKKEMRPSYVDELIKAFQNDKKRALARTKENLLVCISRHAYDIAGMSTDRGWESCMKIENNYEELARDDAGRAYNRFLEKDIVNGSLVAYLIRENDKNLKHPLGRVLLKPYLSKSRRILVAAYSCYGTVPDNFIDFVQDWAYENFNKGKWGVFRINSKVYGSDSPVYFENFPKEEDLAKMKFKYVIRTFKEFLDFMKQNYKKISIDDMHRKYKPNFVDFRQLRITEQEVIDNPYDIIKWGDYLLYFGETKKTKILIQFIYNFAHYNKFLNAKTKKEVKSFLEKQYLTMCYNYLDEIWEIHQNMAKIK
jgi:hypothetical protein